MAVPMDNASEGSSRERVRHLYNKNVELETKRRRSAQARIPSDSNAWQQMRENFETIILEDHAFAQQHEVEFALWQLHYKRIEELRANFNAAMASGSSLGQGGKSNPSQPDRVTKIRSQLKTFLSEATGFYHELMLKIRAKYGLPLGYLSEDTENEAVLSEEGSRFAELKKGMMSCHRCLIYLGDLARYKGIYGEEKSKLREFAAAASYYTQAAAFWPLSGNPHHQLAILATYSSDEFVAIYHYFRSLAVENPFSMARDNLIIAFEKNRLNYSQLIGGAKNAAPKPVYVRMNGKGRARGEARYSAKDHKAEAGLAKERASSSVVTLKTFSVKFVRLNGILFTRTSMETFADVLAMAKNDFVELFSSHKEDNRGFGTDAAESGLFIVRLVAIMIYSIHNANRESEDQSQQRSVLLQNAFTAAYDFMGLVLERCLKLQDPLSAFLLPGVLVFVEWLASRPEVLNGDDGDKPAKVRTLFWNNCISLFNKLLSTRLVGEDADETIFSDLSRYEECDASRLALWEDFELRGFLPLQSAQQVLDFSRKHSPGSERGNREKRARAHRILAAGKTFSSLVRVGDQVVYFDPVLQKFAIGPEPQISCDSVLNSLEISHLSGNGKDVQAEKRMAFVLQESSPQFVDGEDEEEIVFKPSTADKHVDETVLALTPDDVKRTVAEAPLGQNGQMGNYVEHVAPSVSAAGWSTFGASPTISTPVSNDVTQHAIPVQPYSSNWQLREEASILNGFRNMNLNDNVHSMNMKLQEHYGGLQPPSLTLPSLQSVNPGAAMQHAHETVMPSKYQSNLSSVSAHYGASVNSMSLLPVGSMKNPVSRPSRHAGPPPGFSSAAPTKHSAEMTIKDDLPLMDDYSWLDGYQTPLAVASSGLGISPNLSMPSYNDMSKCNGNTGMITFPFPGKQASAFQVPAENSKTWQDYHFSQPLNLFQEQHQQLVQNGSQQVRPPLKQFLGQSFWEGQFLA